MLKLLQDVDDEPAEEESMASRATVAVKVWLRMVCRRFATLALADLTKVFLSGFFWQLGGFLAQDGLHLANTNAWYSLCTGIGDGLGVFIGTVIFDALVYALFGIGGLGRDSFANALVLVCGGVCSGAAWQPMLNAVSDAGMPFVQGACVVGSACGLFFWAGVSAGELVKMQTGEGSPRSKRREYRRELYFSATLSLAIAGAAACFVGTDAKYRGNFLQSLVGERDHSSNVVNAVRAGFSTALGFMVVEAVLNLVVPAGWLWLDEQWKGRVVDGHPAGSSRGSSLVFGPSLNMDLLDSESQSGEFGDGRGVV